jgi:hypothetical protein
VKMSAVHALLHDDEGLTIVEIVVALSILLVALMGIVTAMTFSAQAAQTTEVRNRAVNLANERIERARNLTYDEVGTQSSGGVFGAVPGSIVTPETDGEFVVSTSVAWARDPVSHRAEYKNITVNVAWTSPGNGNISLSSGIFGKSDLVNVGDLEVTVLDKDTMLPIPGVTLVVDSAAVGSIARSDVSGSDGKSFFGMMDSGSASIVASGMGYVYDNSMTTAVQVTSDSLTQITIFGQKPSTFNVTVTDMSSVPIAGATCVLDGTKTDPVTLTTNSSGVASFTGLLIDNYTITVTSGTRVPYNGSVSVTTSNQTVNRTVRLAVPALPGAIRIVVTGQSGVALSNAYVTVVGPDPGTGNITGSPAYTSSAGEVVFNGAAVGTYTVSVSKSGYFSQTGLTVVVVSNITATLNVALSPTVTTGTLRVYVVRNNGNPRKNELVTLVSGTRTVTLSTDNNGLAEFTGLTQGQYHVSISNGTISTDAQVTAGQTTVVTLTR